MCSSESAPTIGHGTQISKVEVWAMAKGEHGRQPFAAVNHVAPKKDVAGRGHSSGEFIVSRGPLVSRTGNLAIACDERGY